MLLLLVVDFNFSLIYVHFVDADQMDDSNESVVFSNYTELLASNFTRVSSIFDWRGIVTSSDSDGTADRCNASNLVTFNCTAYEFLLYERGEDVANLWFTIPVTLLDLLILLAGIFGNLAVCMVVVQNRSMHTNTNYYLFNLAVADLLYLLFGLPFEMHMFWHQYPWPFGLVFCKLRSLVTEACSYASVLTIVAFSVERYIAICHPLYSYVMANLQRVIAVIALIWTMSFVTASPFAVNRYVQFLYYPPSNGHELPESGICTSRTEFGLYEASTCLFFIIPLLILINMYACIALKLNKSIGQRTNERLGKCSVQQMKSRSNIIRMLIVIVITFFISWAPFHAQRLVFHYGKEWPTYVQINEYLFTIGGFFYYLSCAINPIIYNVMSQRYRTAFYHTFCCIKTKWPVNKARRNSTICIKNVL